ncbi:hypothetical protein [Enterococcus faecalis]|uniref:hypothetical protein n=1 Tax=Enterococcus faecalis TaxID=1351 RepID=UPI0025B1D554|nr:hypothetical protein [Enterococcus faecalis]MDN3185239.1 hypothetical protein [Enterococcus faecalis]
MVQATEYGAYSLASVVSKEKKEVTVGETVTCKAISGKKITGQVEKFLENTVVVNTGENRRYLVKRKTLKEQGYTVPKGEINKGKHGS